MSSGPPSDPIKGHSRPIWLKDGVRVWMCRLDDDRDVSLSWALSVVNSAERARADRFHFERDRNRFLRARGLVRGTLADQLGVPPCDIAMAFQANGKPVLRGNPVHFNLSHSQDLAVLAISPNQPVGIDVELTTRQVDPLVLAPSCFVTHEVQALRDQPAQLQRFFAFWTAKEAFMKLTGEGMSLDPKLIRLRLDESGWPSGYCVDNRGEARLCYIDLKIPQATCCLAVPASANVAIKQDNDGLDRGSA